MSKCYVKKENGEVVAFSRNPMDGINTEADTTDDDVVEYLSNGTALQQAQKFVREELVFADIQILYHQDSDSRKIATLTAWRTYRKELRNYVQAGAIVDPKPVRPS